VLESSGYIVRDADGGNARTRLLPGGDVSVRAGRDRKRDFLQMKRHGFTVAGG